MSGDLLELNSKVLHSKIDDSLNLLEGIWGRSRDSLMILDSLQPVSLFTFSHRFPTIHVPKEHEYLYRLLKIVPEEQHIDFLKRFVEYLAWSPKYVFDAVDSYPSSSEEESGRIERYLGAMDDGKGLAALFYAMDAAEIEGVEGVLRAILQIGCNDVSQAIGHYFSCTDSVVRLALESGMPAAKNHLFLLTLYMMQSSPIIIREFDEPSMKLEEMLTKLVRKGGFVGYHYMILASGLINNRRFIGEWHYLHALAGLEKILPSLDDTLTPENIDSMVKGLSSKGDIEELKRSIWKGDKTDAFIALRQYMKEHGATQELMSALAHTFTKINDHPHDPHYVTFPTSAFELTKHVKEDEVELLLAQVVDFASDRARRIGVMKSPSE